MKCRVILLNPPSGNLTLDQFPLNLAYLSSVLENKGHRVKCLDMTAPFGNRKWDAVEKAIEDFEPYFFGVTLTIDHILSKYEFINKLKKQFNIPIIVGGPHASCLPEESLKYCADFVCIGEGEEIILEFAEYILGNCPLDKIDGLAYIIKGKVIYNKPRKPIKDLDSIPFPAYHHFPVEHYAGTNNPNFNRLFWKIFTSRGCPFKCIYCVSRKVFDNRWRMRSVKNIFDEISLLVKRYGVTHIAIQDDEPLINKKNILELCDLLIESKLDVKISCRGRIDDVKTEVLIKMKQAGFYFLAFGTESGDDDTLEKINKHYRYHDIFAGLKAISEAGYSRISVSVLCGFPWETPKHFNNNVRFIKSIPSTLEFYVGPVIVIPYPGTLIYEQYHRQYGFTEWWLKKPEFEHLTIPDNVFFKYWMPGANLIDNYNKNFWHYSKKTRRSINWMALRIEVLSLKSQYSGFSFIVLLLMNLLSLFLYRRWPRLEYLLFSRLTRPTTIDKLKQILKRKTEYSKIINPFYGKINNASNS